MFKKRNLKTSTAKRRNADDDLDSDSVTSITAETSKRAKLPSQSVVTPSSNESKTPHYSSNIPKKSTQDSSNMPEKPAQDGEKKEIDRLESESTPKVSGPKGAPKNIRVTTLTDFQPDVCKDFQQTGYCGYGDTCKFLHIRGESKAKKPVEKEWETVGKKTNTTENLPFKCVICKNSYTRPVKTLCGHVFCRECFMGRFRAGKSKCVICRQETGGSVQPTTVT